MRFVGERGKTFVAQANAQRFERVGGPDAPLVQTWPEKPSQPKSATRTRIEQSVAVGVAVTLCPATCALSVGHPPSLAALGALTTVVSSGVFVASVALGSDNWKTIFGLLDRNKDGRITRADLEDILNDWFGEDEQTATKAPAPPIERGLMVYGADGQGRLLLPDLPRHQVLQMARRMAVRFLAGRLPDSVRYNVSKRGLGAPWNDYLPEVQATLLELGLVKLGGNNTHELTDQGADWLAEVLENA